MIARQIGETCGVEPHGVNTAKIESVGRSLDRRVRATGLLELVKHQEQIE